ncbi:hypothetical protein A4A49_29944 [Nicotiana attenuata]|uniref:Uncharacterized protein n=1 Tax=Nicotiana attenuata TaxID=49451 RepID=A0A1J6KCZ8_NICAT|nr:hypothetical protein A4A49_29944 [Nicotiana attenuata]
MAKFSANSFITLYHDNIVPTAKIQPQSTIKLSRIGGKMLLPATDQELYETIMFPLRAIIQNRCKENSLGKLQ